MAAAAPAAPLLRIASVVKRFGGFTAVDHLSLDIGAGEFFALEGLSQLLLTVREIRATANPRLRIAGVVLTM